MPKAINSAWVKIVNRQRLASSLIDNNPVYKSDLPKSIQENWLKLLFNEPDLLNYSSLIYTAKQYIFDLLDKSFTHNPQPLLLRVINEI